MRLLKLHNWNVGVRKAIEIQNKFSCYVVQQRLDKPVKIIAGCDVAFDAGMNIACAGVVLLSFPELKFIYKKAIFSKVKFPYIPGFLSFRETPLLLKVFKEIEKNVDLVLVDGYGIAHPRKFGIASHLGLFLDLPAIGCGKTFLLGEYKQPGITLGSYEYLFFKGEIIGAVVRTKTRVKPIFVSVGHKITLDDAVDYTLKSCKGYRLPEPIRQAHLLVNSELKQNHVEEVQNAW